MDQQRVDLFIAMNGSKFPEETQMEIREILHKADDSKAMMLQAIEYKDPSTMLIISLMGGGLGIDRFMLGETGKGVGKLILTTFCMVGIIWVIIDWFSIQRDTKVYNYTKFKQAAAGIMF